MMHGTTGSTIDVLQTVGATVSARPSPLLIKDDFLPEREHKLVRDYLSAGGWKFGWKSHASKDNFSVLAQTLCRATKRPRAERARTRAIPVRGRAAEDLAAHASLSGCIWQGTGPQGPHALSLLCQRPDLRLGRHAAHRQQVAERLDLDLLSSRDVGAELGRRNSLVQRRQIGHLGLDLSEAEPAGDISGQHAARRARRVPHLPGAARRAGL